MGVLLGIVSRKDNLLELLLSWYELPAKLYIMEDASLFSAFVLITLKKFSTFTLFSTSISELSTIQVKNSFLDICISSSSVWIVLV